MRTTCRYAIMRVLVTVGAAGLFAAMVATGLAFLLTPAARAEASPWLHVTALSSIPADGTPRKYSIYSEHRDAWTMLPDRLLGYVYLRHAPSSQDVDALCWVTPFGSILTYDGETNVFREPCWGMKYDSTGKCLTGERDLQHVGVQLRDGAVFVKND